MQAVELHSTCCAICQIEGNATELYRANFDWSAFNAAVFSARRLPDRIHYRVVKCNTCGLVRSDPIAPPEFLARLYAQSTFDYANLVADLKLTYSRYLAKLVRYGTRKDAFLEIGCGNGFFLEEALQQGYTSVHGVEPSAAVVAQANPKVRAQIICDIMRAGLFEPNQFNAVCLFQIFDHVDDPGALLDECFRMIKPGGLILCLNHNITAVSATLLKERSPIIDIEHAYLYSPQTISRIFTAHGFRVKEVGSALNTYALSYLMQLLPLPSLPKRMILFWLKNNSLGRIHLTVPLGNLYTIAQKPTCEER